MLCTGKYLQESQTDRDGQNVHWCSTPKIVCLLQIVVPDISHSLSICPSVQKQSPLQEPRKEVQLRANCNYFNTEAFVSLCLGSVVVKLHKVTDTEAQKICISYLNKIANRNGF